jgi:DNA polymerase III subunit delta
MRLRNDQLSSHLKRDLAPVYLLSGDEPLQMMEAADEIRSTARKQGFTEREVLDQVSSFDWSALNQAAENLSLFGDRRILELRLTSAKLGIEGGKALQAYCERPAEDTVLLVSLPKLEKTQMKSKWLQAVDHLGVVVQVWPIEGTRLIPWIEQRLRQSGLVPEAGVVAMLADRVEGNLLAASQEIEKLLLLQGEGVVSQEQLAQAVADSARFDVFGFLDTLMAGEAAKGLRMLSALKAEGVAAPVVLWALSREIRALAEMANEMEQGQNLMQVMMTYRVWEKRKPIVKKALSNGSSSHWRNLLMRCSEADQAIKGINRTDPWLVLKNLAQGVSGISCL